MVTQVVFLAFYFWILIILVPLILLVLLVIQFFSRYNPRNYKENKDDFIETHDKVKFFKPKGETPYLAKFDKDGNISNEPFKILCCTDMHMSTEEHIFGLTVLDRLIQHEKPDLVVLNGDNIVGHEDEVLHKQIIKFFEDRKLYYGFVLGNHDSEVRITKEFNELEKDRKLSISKKEEVTQKYRKWAFEALAKSKYCVVYDEVPELHGSGNCFVNIRNKNGVSQSLIFIDSGDYFYGQKRKDFGTEKRCYEYLRKDQIDWYKDSLNRVKKENNNNLPSSIAFFHIPLQEFQTAFKLGIRFSKKAKIIYGNNFEKACYSDVQTPFFETVKNIGSTKIIVCGHDHRNDSLIEYQGVKLMYSQGLQFDGSYNRRKRQKILKFINSLGGKFTNYNEGASIFTILENGDVKIRPLYARNIDAYKGLDKYYPRALWIKGRKNDQL